MADNVNATSSSQRDPSWRDPVNDTHELSALARERRLNVRAYNYWASLLDGRNFPSVVDLDPDRIEPFRDNSILLDFSRDPERPSMRYVGKHLRDECGLRPGEQSPEAVPGRSMLSRLTDHYLEIIANRAPIGFEAEFDNMRGNLTRYRGILLPLSDDDDTINFIYGVINWKEVVPGEQAGELLLDLKDATALPDEPAPADELDAVLDLTDAEMADAEPDDLLLDLSESTILTPGSGEGQPLELVDAVEPEEALDVEPDTAPEPEVSDPALTPYVAGDLVEDLESAQAAAERVKSVDSRSRAALYDALDAAYRFYSMASARPEAYASLLEARGMKMQERAPFTPVVKLVFGTDYDKTRLTEYAAAMNYASREDVKPGALRDYIERFDGGLKGLVHAERDIRAKAQGNRRVDKLALSRGSLAQRAAIARVPLSVPTDAEFVLLVARPTEAGMLEVIEVITSDQPLIDAAVRKAGRARRADRKRN